MNNPYNFDPPVFRVEDGVQIPLTAREQQAILNDWTANMDARIAEQNAPQPSTLDQRLRAVEAKVGIIPPSVGSAGK